MKSDRGIVLYLQVHQPWRVRRYDIFDVAQRHNYFSEPDDPSYDNELIFHRIANKSYLKMNALLESLLAEQPDFKLSLGITGSFIDQAMAYDPEVIESFKRLVDTGRVEILSETYNHSLAFFYSRREFEAQVSMHRQKVREVFGVETKVFRNTELAYDNELAQWAEDQGFEGILAEGSPEVLGWRSPNYVYRPAGTDRIKLLMRNRGLSDDLAFRFSDRQWSGWPLTADKYRSWIRDDNPDAPITNLFMDYEVFGEHQSAQTGIFEFFEQFVRRWLSEPKNKFYTASEAIALGDSEDSISIPRATAWADSSHDLSAWTGNSMQREALKYLYDMEDEVLATDDLELINDWRRLQTTDHLYYISTKDSNDGQIHRYFSPYSSPYDAFLYYLNAIRDIRWRVNAKRYGGGVSE
ncbi:alpha-amylase [Candidatus Saccharibacteria bacterium 32-49-12]|nr:MAG: alpha-amylase [Candidatus Saccharibacteria bacterium 32-49-12]